uniref:Secreted protein n=1 Tax=Caenorhabditis tropicalis TaxID=1561998 RepID=A0A1I7T4G1_9PELO
MEETIILVERVILLFYLVLFMQNKIDLCSMLLIRALRISSYNLSENSCCRCSFKKATQILIVVNMFV